MVDTGSLTKRQKEIFEYVKTYARDHGYPPTVRDIGKAIGLTSSSTVHAHLANLEKLGLLKRDPTKPRAIEVLVDKAKAVVTPNGLPLVGGDYVALWAARVLTTVYFLFFVLMPWYTANDNERPEPARVTW